MESFNETLNKAKIRWTQKRDITEKLLYGVSQKIRNACYSGVIRGFYDESRTNLSNIILEKTGFETKTIKDIILLGDVRLLDCHTDIERRIYEDLKNKGFDTNPERFRAIVNYNSDIYDYGINVGKRARTYFKTINEHHNIPKTYLINYLKSLRESLSIPTVKVVFKLDEPIYKPEDSIRDKLKGVNKCINRILFGILSNVPSKETIISKIKRQRYISFYGIDITQQQLIDERTTKKSVKQLFDVMDDRELAHHLNISTEILSFLMAKQNQYITIAEMIDRVRAIAFKEALEVHKKEGIKPIDYQQQYIEAHPITDMNQISLFK